jgi:hypothetical protein
MAHYNVTLSVAHDPLTWRESRYFEDFKFTFRTFAEVQAFAKEKFEDRKLPRSGGHHIYITPVAGDGTTGQLMIYKYANWPQLANGNYSHMDEALYNN